MKTILLIIALTIAGNATVNGCLRNVNNLTKSIKKITLYHSNGMTTNEDMERSSAKFYAVNVVTECDGDNEAMRTAKAMGERTLKKLQQ